MFVYVCVCFYLIFIGAWLAKWILSVPSVRKVSARFDSTSSRHVGILGKSFTRNCLYDGCNSLLSSVHTLLVNILRCVRLYIKRKYYYSHFCWVSMICEFLNI